MTDREQVARAMYLSEYLPLDPDAAATWERYDVRYSSIKQRWLALADAALAVIDAEPTQAEITAALEAFWNEPNDHDGEEPTMRQCMRAALIAARKAGKE